MTLLSLLLAIDAAGAEFDLGLGEPGKDGADEARVQVIFSGQLDFRFAYTGDASNWWHDGGGLTQYGALTNVAAAGGQLRQAVFHLTRIGLETDVLVKNLVAAHVQVNYDDHPASSESHESIGVVEAYISPALNGSSHGRVGILIPPISMEQTEVAWTNAYTITPSAISAWAGEELKVLGVEVGHTFKLGSSSITVLAAPFTGNDTAGAILSWRGWALHDYQLKTGDRLPFQPDIDPALTGTGWTTPFTDADGHPGIYGKIVFDFSRSLRVEGFYYNSLGNDRVATKDDFGKYYGWKTVFGSLGVKYEASNGLTLMGQGLYGNTGMGPGPTVDNSLYAWFLLASYKYKASRFSFRYDRFGVIDHDNQSDQNSQRGSAETIAYFYEIATHHQLGAEYVHPVSERNGNTGISRTDPFDDLSQATYRFTF